MGYMADDELSITLMVPSEGTLYFFMISGKIYHSMAHDHKKIKEFSILDVMFKSRIRKYRTFLMSPLLCLI